MGVAGPQIRGGLGIRSYPDMRNDACKKVMEVGLGHFGPLAKSATAAAVVAFRDFGS